MRREKGSKRNWDALGALLIVAMVSLWLGMGTARAQQPPGTTLIYAGYNSFVTDGNLSNANEWYNPVSGNPYNAVPGASDAATVVDGTFGPQFKIPNGTVTGSLNCWGAGFNAREEPLTIDASASTGAGGLAISGDPYGPSAANLQVAASTTGPASTQAAVNINAALTAGAWMYAGGNTQINNTSVSSKGLVVVGTSVLGLNSGATLTTGRVGTIPPAITGADFYSTTTALQVEASSVYINSGSLACNGDAVIGTMAAETGLSNIGVVSVAGGGSLTTTGVTRLGVINPNADFGPPLQGQAGSGTVFVSGSGSLWHAGQDVRVGDDTQGSGFVYVQNGAKLQLDMGTDLRLGSSDGGLGSITFDGTGNSPTLMTGASNAIIVGDQSSGILNVQNGASITHGGTIDVGSGQNSNGSVTVTGSNSSMTIVGSMTVGDSGVGSLSVGQSATVHAESDVVVGAALNSQICSVSLSDAGTLMKIDGNLIVGQRGNDASVTVQNGAVLKVNGTSIILGQNSDGDGTLTIDGPNSQVTADSANGAGGKLVIGEQGGGTLSLTNGASFTMPAAMLGAADGSSGTVKVDGSSNGQPSTFTTSGSIGGGSDGLDIGGGGTGALIITSGGVVVTPGSATIGTGSGTGQVIVSGNSSQWKLGTPVPGKTLPGDLTIGKGTGRATLEIINEAQVEIENLNAGDAANSNATINVDTATLSSFVTNLGFGTGSTFAGTVIGSGSAGSSQWNISGQLILAAGQLTVENGGILTVTGQRAFVGYNNAFLDVSNGQLSANQMNIGSQGTGTLKVEQGSSVSVTDLTVGGASGETGTITVDGSAQPNGKPATLIFSNSAQIGQAGSAMMNIVGGGVVSSDGVPRFNIDGTGAVNCSGTGSSLAIPHMDIYTGTNGYLSVTSSAKVQAAGVYLSSFNGSSSSNAVLGGATLQVGLDGLTVGNSGPGQLTIDGGGTVNVLGPINIGTSANDPGKVVVGNGSLTTTSSQSITVGGGGLSSLVLNAGANVSAGFLTINGIGSVRAGGSTNSPAFLSVAQAIVVGPTGSLAALNLSSGASVSTATLAIGPQGGVDLTGGGTASIGTVIIPPAAGSMSIGFGGMVKDNGSIQGQVTLLGGRLGGSGKVNGKFINGGFVAPGDPQTLTIVGDYQQTGSGELELQIAGAGSGEYDQLDITGNIELDSGAQLNLDFINGFAPTTGDTFDILSDSNLTSADSFSQINVGGLEPGWEYAIEQQNGNEVIKSLNNGVAVPEPSTAAMGIFLFVAMTILHWIRRIVVPVSAVQWPPAEMHAPSA